MNDLVLTGDDELPDDDIAAPLTAKVDDEPVAEYSGILKLGDFELPCFVLSNKKRVLIMREVVQLLTGNRKGGLVRYTSAAGVREYMPQ